jgi:hypothetical protein
LKRNSNPFKWRHFEPTIILLCVRWYCRFQLSYRDVEEMLRERGLDMAVMPKGRRSLSLRSFRSLPERKAFEELSCLELIFATLPVRPR